jgi:adenylate kinase family enzyme
VQRVLVIGSGGAGKTTLARRIATAASLPLVHLDRLYWRPGWVPTPADEWELQVAELVRGERWVMDGNYGGTMALRVAAADTVVFLDVPRLTCLRRVTSRALRHRGRTRDDMAPDCPEHLSWEFVRWIWSYPRTRRPRVLELLAQFERTGGDAVVLRDSAEIDSFLRSAAGRSA